MFTQGVCLDDVSWTFEKKKQYRITIQL